MWNSIFLKIAKIPCGGGTGTCCADDKLGILVAVGGAKLEKKSKIMFYLLKNLYFERMLVEPTATDWGIGVGIAAVGFSIVEITK